MRTPSDLNNSVLSEVLSVFVGCSAGGLSALRELFAHCPKEIDMGFVVIQHMSHDHKTHLPEILGKDCLRAGLAIEVAVDGSRVEPNKVLIIPAGVHATIQNSVISFDKSPEVRATSPRSIDNLFCSAASDLKGGVVGVLLSGTGHDGTLGLSAIRDHGGTTMAQDESAEFSEMPQSAIQSEIVDFVLAPKDMCRELERFRDRARQTQDKKDAERISHELLEKIYAILKSHSGVDFSNYRTGTIVRRLNKRVVVSGSISVEQYIERLQSDSDEVENLYRDLLINVTGFFRDPNAFSALEELVLPSLREKADKNTVLRIWIPACSTGEEAYSIAILLTEFLAKNKCAAKFTIFATDIDEQALKQAREGRYTLCSVNTVAVEILNKYFDKIDNQFVVKKELRESCVFARQDVIHDPPFSNLDLISCRNLFIYFNQSLQAKVLNIFHYALKPEKFLFLGSSESISSESKQFFALNKEHRIFKRSALKQGRLAFTSEGTAATAWDRSQLRAQMYSSNESPRARDLKAEAEEHLLSRIDWARVVVNEQMTIMFSEGPVEKYLSLPAGAATLNILKMAKASLGIELRAAIHKAANQNSPVVRSSVVVADKHEPILVDIEVVPFRSDVHEEKLYLVLLRNSPRPMETTHLSPFEKNLEFRRTEQELVATREILQSVIAQQDLAAEELRSANEEIVSRNEELQSSNEELETTKEELQAGNEELSTVNDELISRNQELQKLYSTIRESEEKYRALSESASDAIVTTDEEGKLMMWNHAAEKIFGYTAEEALRRNITDMMPPRFRAAHNAGMKRVVKGGEARIVGRTVEIDALRSDGSEFPIELSLSMWSLGGATFFTAIIRDVSERAWARRLQNAKLEIGKTLLQSTSVDEAILQSLRIICQQLNYSLGALWKHDSTKQTLKFEQMWPAATGAYETIAKASESLELKRGEGLPGIAWDQKAAWISDITHDSRFLRQSAFKSFNFNTAVSFSIGRDDEFFGVIEFFTPSCVKAEPTVLALLNDIGDSLNNFIRRRFAEDIARTANEELERAVERRTKQLADSEARHRFLAEASAALTSSIDYQTTLQNIADLSVPRFADWCGVDILSPDNEIVQVAVAHTNPEKVKFVRELALKYPPNPDAPIGSPHVLKTGKSELIENISDEMLVGAAIDADHLKLIRSLELRSYICVPLKLREATIGTVTLVFAESGRIYSEQDLPLVEEIARRAALAVERSRLLNEAQSVNRAKDEFLATLSHELRTPMNIILGWVEILRRERDDETMTKALEMLERNSHIQIKLINDLLDISRIISGKLPLELVPLELGPIVAAIVEDLKVTARDKRVSINFRVEQGNPTVLGDSVRLQQVVQNLINNAVKFTPVGGKVDLLLSSDDRNTTISVRDTGIGIDPAFQKHVFESFKQEDGSTTRSHGGLGLGLAISRYIVAQHGGRIEVQSEGRNKGSVFTVILPSAPNSVVARNLSAGQQLVAPDNDRSETPLVGLKILAIDDSPDILVLLSRKLKRWGAQVTLANSAEEGFAALSTDAYHLVLCDIGMPKQDGISFIRELRSKHEREGATTPAIALTAYARKEEMEAVIQAGFRLHVAKPVSEEVLLSSILKVVNR